MGSCGTGSGLSISGYGFERVGVQTAETILVAAHDIEVTARPVAHFVGEVRCAHLEPVGYADAPDDGELGRTIGLKFDDEGVRRP